MPMRRFLLPALVLASALAGCLSERSTVTETPAGDLCDNPTASTVRINNFAFGATEIRVSRGSRVTWVNCDAVAHTSTSDSDAWDSGLISPNTTFSRTFDQAGRFPYHCEPHPGMQAVVVVE
ncbi:MAG: plastocyanin/azurin family copper-binding protein [Gemmatimonadota bacterium]